MIVHAGVCSHHLFVVFQNSPFWIVAALWWKQTTYRMDLWKTSFILCPRSHVHYTKKVLVTNWTRRKRGTRVTADMRASCTAAALHEKRISFLMFRKPFRAHLEKKHSREDTLACSKMIDLSWATKSSPPGGLSLPVISHRSFLVFVSFIFVLLEDGPSFFLLFATCSVPIT